MTKEEIVRIANESNVPFETNEMERIVTQEEDASLKSPGVPAHYYRFFYQLIKRMNPKLIVELGTYTGISAYCMAKAAPQAKVITVDHDYRVKPECVLPNIQYFRQDSLELPEVDLSGIDILFIDTLHDGVRCQREYDLYHQFVKRGGIIFFDDIHLFDLMDRFWDGFNPKQGEKFELPVHGKAGFGVVLT